MIKLTMTRSQDRSPRVGEGAKDGLAAGMDADQEDPTSDDAPIVVGPPSTTFLGKFGKLVVAAALAVVVLIAASLYTSGAGTASKGSGVSRTKIPVVLEGRALSFVSIGDWGRQGQFGQSATAASMASTAELIRASFVVSVGDNFYDSGVDTADDPQFHDSFSAVYSQRSLAMPWFTVAGNHDYRGNLTAQHVFSADPRWVFPALNYTHAWPLPGGQGCLSAVFIDTTPLIGWYRAGKEDYGRMVANINATVPPEEQYRWIGDALAEASRECAAVIVVGHHPVYTAGEHGDNQDLVTHLLPLLQAAGVDGYWAGHDHLLNHLVGKGDAHFVVTGGGSKVRGGREPSPQTTFMWQGNGYTAHSVNGTHISYSYLDGLTGEVLYEMVRPLKPKGKAGRAGGGEMRGRQR